MKFHVITGQIRTGSQLFCDIMNQNPRHHASSTSHILPLLAAASNVWNTGPNALARLRHDREGTGKRILASPDCCQSDTEVVQGRREVGEIGGGIRFGELAVQLGGFFRARKRLLPFPYFAQSVAHCSE